MFCQLSLSAELAAKPCQSNCSPSRSSDCRVVNRSFRIVACSIRYRHVVASFRNFASKARPCSVSRNRCLLCCGLSGGVAHLEPVREKHNLDTQVDFRHHEIDSLIHQLEYRALVNLVRRDRFGDLGSVEMRALDLRRQQEPLGPLAKQQHSGTIRSSSRSANVAFGHGAASNGPECSRYCTRAAYSPAISSDVLPARRQAPSGHRSRKCAGLSYQARSLGSENVLLLSQVFKRRF